LRRVNIETRYIEPVADEMARNRQSHFAETDDAYLPDHSVLLTKLAL
jgi:hypothetical protein